jgi:hypothetical protein
VLADMLTDAPSKLLAIVKENNTDKAQHRIRLSLHIYLDAAHITIFPSKS